MAEIIPNQTFKHGTRTYEAGEPYDVSEDEAQYFKSAGWVGPKTTGAEVVTLCVQDVQLGHAAEVK